MWSMVLNVADRSKRVRAVTDHIGHIGEHFRLNGVLYAPIGSSHKASFVKVSL